MKIKALLYCTKAKPYLLDMPKDNEEFKKGVKFSLTSGKNFKQACIDINDYKLNGKIVAECDYEIEKVEYKHIKERDKFGILHNGSWYEYKGTNVTHYECDLASRSGFDTNDKLFDYLSDYLVDKDGYVIDIKNLNIFDRMHPLYSYKPKELSNYYKIKNVGGMLFTKKLTNSPKNMMRVSINPWGYAMYNPDDIRVIIPVSPEEMCRILNKEQTVLVRKNVLKETLKNE